MFFFVILFLFSCTSHKPDLRPKDSWHLTAASTSTKDRYSPLGSGQVALAARIHALEEAKQSVDLQYYIWKNDLTGLYMFNELVKTADRGVRVRLLLDYLNQARYLKALTILEMHPQIEVRLINPYFQNLNHRMHNKTFIVDNELAIVGGRNIGNEYFDASGELNFQDYDLLLRGKVVNEVSKEFDAYWNSERSFSISEVKTDEITEKEVKHFAQQMEKTNNSFQKSNYLKGLKDLKEKQTYYGEAELLYDPPAKLEGNKVKTLSQRLKSHLANIKDELILISPYLIPGKNGMKQLKELRKRGVRVIILTNSLASIDVPSVFGGYQKYREDMLQLGIELYEMRPVPGKNKDKSALGSSSPMGLHGKVMIADRKDLYVGSMNLDKRSKNLNTELIVVLRNSGLAPEISRKLMELLPRAAYKVDFHQDQLRWQQNDDGKIKYLKQEPETSKWQRTKAWSSSWLVPESIL